VAGAIFINSIDDQLRDHRFGLTTDQITAVRHSVKEILSSAVGLTEAQEEAVIDVYVNAIRHAFFILAPACVLAGATALLVYNWNVNSRGRREETKSAESA
jgi:hypothetical protein